MTWRDWIDPPRVGWLRLLLVFVPATAVAWLAEAPAVVAVRAGGAGDHPARRPDRRGDRGAGRSRSGRASAGLLNATFGNAAELIIAVLRALRGLDGVVKASLTGSIIGNLLLVLGASLLAGGIRYPIQQFNRTAAGVGATLMVLAAVGLVIPAIFHRLVGPAPIAAEHGLSLSVSVVLIVAYALNLLFSLVTHKDLYNPRARRPRRRRSTTGSDWGRRQSVVVLLVSTAFVAWMSEVLVGAVEEASQARGADRDLRRRDRGGDRRQRRRALDGRPDGLEEPDGPGRRDRDGLGLADRPVRGAGAGLRQLPAAGADGPALHADGGRRGDPRGDPGADGRGGRRVELARRGDAPDDLRDPGLAFFFLPEARIELRPAEGRLKERAHGGK